MNRVDPTSLRQLAVPHSSSIGNALKEQFADGKWHRLSKIVQQIDRDEDRVRRLDSMLKNQTSGCKPGD
jgi:hypothetical protein